MSLTFYNLLFLILLTSQMATGAYYNRKGQSRQVLYPFSPYSSLVWLSDDEPLVNGDVKMTKNVKRWSKLEPSVRFGDGGSSLDLY
uniref:Secreted protein n=1 Tax=Strongyloides papillosus TaxID=174720 RepID=A0A0N5CAP0_STREA